MMMATAGEPWTVGKLLSWTSDYLKRHGSPSPKLDAEVLLAHVLECPRIGLYIRFAEEVSEPQREAFKTLIRRRAQGEPVAYLVGHKEFYSLTFEVTRDVLIPRPETETLVDAVLDVVRARQDANRSWRILDVGTGCGILAVCLAKFLPQAQVTAVDVSSAALQVAMRNAQLHSVHDRVVYCQSDLVAGLESTARFDIVVSNPPYVSESEYEQLPAEIRQFEPYVALVAGPTGTEIIQRLLLEVPKVIVPGGWLMIEISPLIADRVRSLIEHSSTWQLNRMVPDLAGHVRVAVVEHVPGNQP